MNKFEIWDEERWHEQMRQDTEIERLGEFESTPDLDNFSLWSHNKKANNS